jgi:hypothetical protein
MGSQRAYGQRPQRGESRCNRGKVFWTVAFLVFSVDVVQKAFLAEALTFSSFDALLRDVDKT